MFENPPGIGTQVTNEESGSSLCKTQRATAMARTATAIDTALAAVDMVSQHVQRKICSNETEREQKRSRVVSVDVDAAEKKSDRQNGSK